MINTRQELLNRARSILLQMALETTSRNKDGLYDFTVGLEDFFTGLLNFLYQRNYVNKNLLKTNYPAIDLSDDGQDESDGRGFAIQVTSTNSRDKLRNTVKTFKDKQLQDKYKYLGFLIVTIEDAVEFTPAEVDEYEKAGFLVYTANVQDIINRISACESLFQLEWVLGYIEANLLGHLQFGLSSMPGQVQEVDFEIVQNFFRLVDPLNDLVCNRSNLERQGRTINEPLYDKLETVGIKLSSQQWNNFSGLRCRHPVLRAHQERVRNIIFTLYLLTRGREWVRRAAPFNYYGQYDAPRNLLTYLPNQKLAPYTLEHLQRIQNLMDQLPMALMGLKNTARTI